MTRLEFFLAAMQAGMYRNRNWVISAFAVTQEAPEAWQKDPFPYRIVQLPSGSFYVNPEDPSKLEKLADAVAHDPSKPGSVMPPFFNKELIKLEAGQVPNLFENVETTYGKLLANFMLLVYPFGAKIPYQNKRMAPRQLEDLILPLMVDEPEPSSTSSANVSMPGPNSIPVTEYLKFTNAMTYISGFADLWVTGGTRKMLLPPPNIKEIRDKLIAQYKDRLGDDADPTAVALVAKELQKVDAEWLAGDDTLNFLINKKSFEVVRAKKFLMIGGEAGLGDGSTVELVENSLAEGWDVNKMPAMVNLLRAGAFNRGAETMRGGESVKWLLRASANINILPTDCGTRLGRTVTLKDSDRSKYLNFSIIDENAKPASTDDNVKMSTPGMVAAGTIRLTSDEFPKWVGKKVTIRSPMYCSLPHTDYCAICAGPRLAENPTGASSAISDYGSTMLLMFMKANHGKALTLAKYDFKNSIV